MKYLLVLLVALVGLWWLWGRGAGRRTPDGGPATKAKPASVEMVACAHCGVHLPQVDALAAGDAFFCSEPHRKAGPRPR